jgi:hypothetical protein
MSKKNEIAVTDDEIVRYEIYRMSKRIKECEEDLKYFNSYRNELIEKGINAVKYKDFTMIYVKAQKEHQKIWGRYFREESL